MDDDDWKEIIYRDGKIDEEQVMKELADYSFVMQQVSKVYDHITGGALSKVMYPAETVIAAADDFYNKQLEDALADELKELQDENQRLKESEEREQWYDNLVQTELKSKYPSLKAYVEALQAENQRLREALEGIINNVNRALTKLHEEAHDGIKDDYCYIHEIDSAFSETGKLTGKNKEASSGK